MTVRIDEKQLAQILEVFKWFGAIVESLVTQLKRLNENLEKG